MLQRERREDTLDFQDPSIYSTNVICSINVSRIFEFDQHFYLKALFYSIKNITLYLTQSQIQHQGICSPMKC